MKLYKAEISGTAVSGVPFRILVPTGNQGFVRRLTIVATEAAVSGTFAMYEHSDIATFDSLSAAEKLLARVCAGSIAASVYSGDPDAAFYLRGPGLSRQDRLLLELTIATNSDVAASCVIETME